MLVIEPKVIGFEEMNKVTSIIKEYFVSRGFRVISADHFIPISNTVSLVIETNNVPEKLISYSDLDDYLRLYVYKLYYVEILKFHLTKDKISMDLWVRVKET